MMQTSETRFSIAGRARSGHIRPGGYWRSRATVNQSLELIRQLEAAVRDAGAVMERLNQDSVRIAEMVDVINGVADQTNLLASMPPSKRRAPGRQARI